MLPTKPWATIMCCLLSKGIHLFLFNLTSTSSSASDQTFLFCYKQTPLVRFSYIHHRLWDFRLRGVCGQNESNFCIHPGRVQVCVVSLCRSVCRVPLQDPTRLEKVSESVSKQYLRQSCNALIGSIRTCLHHQEQTNLEHWTCHYPIL